MKTVSERSRSNLIFQTNESVVSGAFANFAAAAAAAAGDQSGAAIADGQQNGLDILQANLSWIDRDFDLALQNLDRALGSVAPTSGPTQPVLGATGTVHGEFSDPVHTLSKLTSQIQVLPLALFLPISLEMPHHMVNSLCYSPQTLEQELRATLTLL